MSARHAKDAGQVGSRRSWPAGGGVWAWDHSVVRNIKGERNIS